MRSCLKRFRPVPAFELAVFRFVNDVCMAVIMVLLSV
jgi:hypothetical protein